MTAAAVAVAGLSKGYGRVKALDDVSFAVPTGSVTALLGLNGAGKTTLFQILTGLFVADAGRVSVFGDDIAAAPVRALGHMGIVFQQPVLDLDLTVRQNLAFHAGLHGLKRHRAAAAIAAGLARFRIGDLAARRVRELSGGTRRKVELARALVTSPRLLLLDEPSQGLDTRSRSELVADVFALAAERGTTVLWATHLVAEVAGADRVVVLHRGRVAADGTPAELIAAEGVDSLEAAFLAIARSGAAEAA
ncbi:ATP-binding cassette domain-containing protein [Lichenibacterium minor]|uniref:ATP-binding cassette domain-containing protein n=2 Tax=Lichenibacterium minor TaxID=2316528 RepID=A0A4Q2U2Q8_9HYPH|nr:ATP-binding cassette domain-containing protein [Lichenibacterium minor]